jgi:hypothetical protein
MVARPTAIMVRVGSRTGSLSALAPGMAGDVHITEGPTVAALTADLRDAGLRDVALMGVVLIDMVRRFGAASKGAARLRGSAEGSREDPGAAANKLIGSSGDRAIGSFKVKGF